MTLAERQAELLRALVAGGGPPAGIDPGRLDAARKALLRKRARVVRAVWPRLAASYGDRWTDVFGAWADGRPTRGALLDGYDFAREHPPSGPAGVEYLVHEVTMRRGPALRIGHGVIVVKVARRVRVIP